jgi:uncharacterized protein
MEGQEFIVVVLAVLVGFGSGVLSGMLGIGGAVLSTPAVRVLGATPIQAVGSTVPAILPGALVGVWRYHRAGLVDWRIGLWCGGTGAFSAVAGALVANALPEPRWLMVITAALMLASGWSVARSGRRAGRATELTDEPDVPQDDAPEDAPGDRPAGGPQPAVGRLALFGLGAGFVAGLLGVGGGIVLLPVFTRFLGLPVRRAVASSLLAVAIFSVPALITHALAGSVDWSLALALAVGVVPGAQVGSTLTVSASDRTVRLVFGVVISVLAVVYGVSELAGLRG